MKLSLVVLGLAIVVGLRMAQQKATTAHQLKHWHQGPEWERMFKVYDEMAEQQFGQHTDCTSRIITPTQGSKNKWSTQIHACGDPANPPVFFLHAVSTCSLMFGDWLIPSLKQDFYTIAVDFPCDAGRSGPVSGDATHDCPQNSDEVTDWFSDLKHQLIDGDNNNGDKATNKKVSLVGYSYGSFFSSLIALKMPKAIDKVIFMAPAAVFAPLTAGWMWRAMVLGLVTMILPFQRVQKRMSLWFFRWLMAPGATMEWNGLHADLYEAADNVPLQLPILPVPLNVTTLSEMNKKSPMLLIIGDEEVVIDAPLAVKNANDAGVATKVYKNSGHMLVDEHPRQPVISVVKSFLGSGVYNDDDDAAEH